MTNSIRDRALRAITAARDPTVLAWSVLGVLVAGYTVAMSAWSIAERTALDLFDEDLAIYDQIVWNTSRGHFFQSTLIQHANTMLGDHFSPAVALFAPIYWIAASANVLLIGQSLLLALTAAPFFLFARGLLGNLAAILVSVAYLLYPALHFANLFQFHEITMLPLPLAAAFLAIERGSRRWFAVAAVLALTVKEEVAIVICGAGLLWWLRRRDWQTMLATMALGVTAGFLTLGLILPHFSQAGEKYYYVSRYAYLGNSPLGMVGTLLTDPSVVLAHLVATDRLMFLGELGLPLLLLPLVGWEYIVAAIPVFGYLLLAESPDQYAIGRHYLSPLLPFLFFGATLGLGRLANGFDKVIRIWLRADQRPRSIQSATRASVQPRAVSTVLSALVLVLAVAGGSYAYGPTPLGRGYRARSFTTTEHTQIVRQVMASVPAGATVSTSRNLLSWFSERSEVYRFPDYQSADYVLLDWIDLRYPTVFGYEGGAFGNLLANPNYRMVDSVGAVTLFHRDNEFALPSRQALATRFGSSIELLDGQIRSGGPPDTVEVMFSWRAITRVPLRYTVFVHLIGPDGATIDQADSWPLDNLYPTDLWEPGRVIPDTHVIAVHTPRAAGAVRVEAGLYDVETGKRVPITSRGLPGGSDYVSIGS